MSDNELVTVKKVGQPTLRITRRALDEHLKLGWTHVEDEPAEVEKVDPKAGAKEKVKL